MTLGAATAPGDGGDSVSGNDRSALEGMLKSYSPEQLVDEVLVAWDELSARNDDLVSTKQRLRILELDLAEREDGVAPEVMMLQEAEEGMRDRDARIVHLERMLDDSQKEIADNAASASVDEMESLEVENHQLRNLTEDQNSVIAEMEGKVEQLVEALDKAAQAGLTSVTADEVRALKAQLDQRSGELAAETAANAALEEERQRLRDIADRLRGLLDQRDKRMGELEEQLERVLQGPRSVSAEHDYLVEQIEELKSGKLGIPHAYIGGKKEDNKKILEYIPSGSQGLVFAAPESFNTTLRIPLIKAARKGNLGAVIIDEAHLVYAWGSDFRSDYQVLASLIMLKKWPPWYDVLILMFQKEVANRILAKPHTKEYGRLSVLSNWRLEIKKHFDVSKNSFFPKPKVDSTLLSFKPRKNNPFDLKNPKSLEIVTRVLFSNRRKMINKNFNKLFNQNISISKNLNLDLNSRPEELNNETYYKIAVQYEKLST